MAGIKGMKQPKHTREHKEKIRKIAKEKGFGKWMKGKESPNKKQLVERICKWCGKKKLVRPCYSKRPFCDKKCADKWASKNMKGEKSSNWKGGVTPETNKRVNSKKWKIIREQIYKRDNYCCQICNKINIILHCHHIVPYRITQDNSENNLITLCGHCHMKQEKKYYSRTLEVK